MILYLLIVSTMMMSADWVVRFDPWANAVVPAQLCRSDLHTCVLSDKKPNSNNGDTGEIKSHDLYLIMLPYPVCLICISGRFPYKRRMKHIPRKDVLKEHVERHFRKPEYENRFQCRHPQCTVMLDNIVHFKRHALDVHGVVY